ncbi:MAG: hypothetical protein HY291_12785 [Planctomycetes bacterium]|nr:hypothetical protein [Planctomycetota bacterium]
MLTPFQRSALALLAVALLSLKVSGEEIRRSYRVKGAPAGEDLYCEMLLRSSVEISAEKQHLIAWHFRNAARLAETFARREGVAVQRSTLPARVELFENPQGLSKATGLPHRLEYSEVVSRVDLRHGIVYLGRRTPEDLYVELGKWIFYEAGYRWGQNEDADLRHLALAERFATFCLDEKNWNEPGGSKKSIR